jgi:hypothetical protein
VPKGPHGQKRPRDVVSNAVKVMRIATGEEVEEFEDDGKDPAAKALGEKGGTARARNLSKEQRTEIARNAANVRWRKQKD